MDLFSGFRVRDPWSSGNGTQLRVVGANGFRDMLQGLITSRCDFRALWVGAIGDFLATPEADAIRGQA